MLAVTAWSTGCNLGEPNTWYRETGVSIDPAVTPIVIDGQRINPDGSVLVKVNKVGEKPVTPDVQDNGIKWYRYGLTVGPIKPVTLTWSAHPLLTGNLPDLQAAFDAGARLLAKDDDGPGDGSDTDDTACHLEFFILQARFPTWRGVKPFHHPRFNHVTKIEDLEQLRRAPMSNIKLVSSITVRIPNTGLDSTLMGYATPDGEGMVLVAAGVNSVGVIHEYGHNCGLQHRENENETEAIMCNGYDTYMGTGTEVNATEAAAFLRFSPRPWND
jgi:hypothetical protein